MPRRLVKRSDSEWEDIFRRCRASGQSDFLWCRENGIPLSSFYRHLKNYRNVQIVPYENGTLNEFETKMLSEVHDIVPVTVCDKPGALLSRNMSGSGTQGTAARINIGKICIDLFEETSQDMISSILNAAAKLC